MKERKTLDELLAETEVERQAEIAKDFTPQAIARREAKAAAEKQREIERGLRDANGNWIEQDEAEDEEAEDEDEDE
jgi:hypothetical protein